MELSRIVEIMKYGVFAIPVIVFVVGCISFVRIPERERMGIAAMARKLKSKAVKLLVLCLVYVLLFICVRFVQSIVTGELVVGFNYAEASQGLNPNSTRFNTYDLIDDSVLEQAIADGGFDVSVSDLRAVLSVEPLEAGESVSADQYYVSSEYLLRYQASFKTLTLGAERVLNAVGKAYYDQFQQKYSRKTDVLELDFADVDEADYLDKVELLEKYSSDVSEYMGMCSLESATYVGRTGETFSSLSAKVKNFSSVELEKLRSYVLTKGLSQDKEMQLSKLAYENLIKDITYDKNLASYQIGLETIRMYERDMATIVLVPSRDETGEFYMSRTKLGVDNFADDSYLYSQRATLVEADIAANTYAIGQLSASNAGEGEYAVADEMIEAVKTNLNNFAQQGIEMVSDFDAETKGEYLNFNLDKFELITKSNLVKYAVLVGAMFVAAGVFVIAAPEKKKVQK